MLGDRFAADPVAVGESDAESLGAIDCASPVDVCWQSDCAVFLKAAVSQPNQLHTKCYDGESCPGCLMHLGWLSRTPLQAAGRSLQETNLLVQQ